MVLLAELLLLAGIVYGAYRLAARPEGSMSVVDPDRSPADRDEGPLTADALVAMHIPMGFGYRKVDVDRLLDRVAQQLPRATYQGTTEPGFGVPGKGPFAAEVSRTRPESSGGAGDEPATVDTPDRVSLTKVDDHG